MSIPVIYVFKFDNDKIDKAIKRLNCSIASIINQTNNIYILNASNIDIKSKLNNSEKIVYEFKPYNNYFNKPILINYLVKKHIVGYDYFIHSDIDLLYPNNYIHLLSKHISKDNPIRVIPLNKNFPFECYENYNVLLNKINNEGIPCQSGESRGNGLIHTNSFLRIQGYNEQFNGYSPEDLEFNLRISKINKFIFDTSIIDIHLYHEPFNRKYLEKNDIIYKISKEQIEKNNIIRNTSNWGIY